MSQTPLNQTNMQSNMQSNIHLIVDDISITLKKHLQNLFGDLLTKCDEYDRTNEIILSLPIVKRMLNTKSMHKTTTATTMDMDSDDCVFIKKERLDPNDQTCIFNYDSLIGFVPPKIDEDEDEDEDEDDICEMNNAHEINEQQCEIINLSLIETAQAESVEDEEEEEEEEETGDCDKCFNEIIFSKEGYYVFAKDEDEVCWCQTCFEAGWKQMYKDGWECDAYDHLKNDDPELADTPEKTNNAEAEAEAEAEVNISLNIEEVEDADEDLEEVEDADEVTDEDLDEEDEDLEEEEAVTDEDLEEEEEDEEVFEVKIMGKNYYTNNISTGDIYEIDSAGDPGDQVGQYMHGIPTFIR